MNSLNQNQTHATVQFKTLSSTKLTKHQVVPFKIFYYDMRNRTTSTSFYHQKDTIWEKMKSFILVLSVKHHGLKMDCSPISFVYITFGMGQKFQNYIEVEYLFISVSSGKKSFVHLLNNKMQVEISVVRLNFEG